MSLAASPAASRFERAVAAIDRLNEADPRRVETDTGPQAWEVVYSRRMSAALETLEPGAGEELRLAVRAQHLCRWRRERREHPAGRLGYLEWRRSCARMHAELAAGVLRAEGYGSGSVDRVEALLRKEGLADDAEAQTLEDTACLVFLEHYAADFFEPRESSSIDRILRRTWGKMSPRGREAALGLALDPRVEEHVQRALESVDRQEATRVDSTSETS